MTLSLLSPYTNYCINTLITSTRDLDLLSQHGRRIFRFSICASSRSAVLLGEGLINSPALYYITTLVTNDIFA